MESLPNIIEWFIFECKYERILRIVYVKKWCVDREGRSWFVVDFRPALA